MGLIALIFSVIVLFSTDTLVWLISNIPGTAHIESIIDVGKLTQSNVIYFIVLAVVIVGVGVIGYLAACCKIKWMLYLVSNRCCTVVYIFTARRSYASAV